MCGVCICVVCAYVRCVVCVVCAYVRCVVCAYVWCVHVYMCGVCMCVVWAYVGFIFGCMSQCVNILFKNGGLRGGGSCLASLVYVMANLSIHTSAVNLMCLCLLFLGRWFLV